MTISRAHATSTVSPEDKASRKAQLESAIVSVLRKRPNLGYFQVLTIYPTVPASPCLTFSTVTGVSRHSLGLATHLSSGFERDRRSFHTL